MNARLPVFERHLTVWVLLCIVVSIFFGKMFPLAAAISLFGFKSGAALATVVGVLTEVPIMLSLVNFFNKTRHWFPEEDK